MKRMTVLFEDEELYTAIKVEAARRNRPLKELVTDALREWIEAQEDTELLADIDAAREEWHEQGGLEAEAVFRTLRDQERRRANVAQGGDLPGSGQTT